MSVFHFIHPSIRSPDKVYVSLSPEPSGLPHKPLLPGRLIAALISHFENGSMTAGDRLSAFTPQDQGPSFALDVSSLVPIKREERRGVCVRLKFVHRVSAPLLQLCNKVEREVVCCSVRRLKS